MLAIPVLGRLTRWYRAGAVATLLLVPAAATAVRRPAGVIVLCVAVLADTLLLAPLAWPIRSDLRQNVRLRQRAFTPFLFLVLVCDLCEHRLVGCRPVAGGA